MKRALFCKPGSIIVEYQEHREGPTPIYVAWKPHTAKSFTDVKALLKFCAWPKSTPTGMELREWLAGFNAPTQPEQNEVDPTSHTKVIT